MALAATRLLALGALCVSLGCTRSVRPPDLGTLYDSLAQGREIDRNPVIVIPGVLGSSLAQYETERVVWGAFEGDYAHPGKPDGARLMGLPMRDGVPLDELVDDVRAIGALESLRVSLFGLPVGVEAYLNLLLALGVGGFKDESLAYAGEVDYGDEHFTCFQFAYDWRRDISENAVRFHEFLLEKKACVEEQYAERYGIEDADVKFDVVSHSMGALLARYYLMYGGDALPDDGTVPDVDWEGAAFVDRAIVVAPPNFGSADGVINMMHGLKLSFVVPRYRPALMGTMPSVYQLLPRPEHGAYVLGHERDTIVQEALTPEFWDQVGWGLLDPDEADMLEMLLPDEPDPTVRRRIARDHVAKCLARARQFFAAMDRPVELPEGTELILIAGDALDTPDVVAVDPPSGGVWTIRWAPGDGTVTRASMLADERDRGERAVRLRSPIPWSRAMFFFEDHLGLTRDPAFIDNLLYLLLEEPR